MSKPATPAAPDHKPDQLTLAFERTYLAYERTLMAWIRTATGLITFGFALYKFVFYLHETGTAPVDQPPQTFGARSFGLVLIGTGVLALILATIQHLQQMKRLRQNYPETPRSLSLVLAGLIIALGIMAIVAAVYR